MREAVLQLLFSMDLGAVDVSLLMEQLKASKKNIQEAEAQAERVWAKKKEIDQAVAALSHGFSLKRIHKAELQILRIGAYELLFQPELPAKVVLAEAVRLARKFATPAASLFINAILDQLWRKKEGESVDQKALDEAIAIHDEQSHCEKSLEMEKKEG